MNQKRARKRVQRCKEIEDDDTIDMVMNDHYKRTSFTMKKPYKLNAKHQKLLQYIQDEKTNMVFVDGPAGTAKTYIAVYGALELLSQEKIEEIVYIRSIIESASRSIGALPGEIGDKFQPYAMPLEDKLREIVAPGDVAPLFGNRLIRSIPVNFVRGLTFNNACVIIDETQNLTRKELVTILTRFGRNSTYVVCGDSYQNDIRCSGFGDIMSAFDTEASQKENIHCLKFGMSEIVRSKILKHIVDVIGN